MTKESTDTVEGTVVDVTTESRIPQEIRDEVSGAVKDLVDTAKKEREDSADIDADEAKPVAEEVETEEEPEGVVPGKGEDEEDAITDDHLTRAVMAGMSIADAKAFKDADSLGRVVELLEKKAEDGASDGAGEDKGAKDTEIETLLASIPDLDPDDYDEKVVDGFKALKGIISKLLADKSDGVKDALATGFEASLEALGDKFHSAIGKGLTSGLDPASPQAGMRAALKKKMEILAAGYKAAGEDVDRATVFGEAVKVVLGNVVQSVADTALADKAKQRSSQHTQRPQGSGNKPTTDAFTAVADKIQEKFYKE